jgi:hypothetical protein
LRRRRDRRISPGRRRRHDRRFAAFENGGDREVFIAETINGQILRVLFADNVKSRELLENGSYRRRVPGPGEMPIDAQRVFLTQAQAMG